MAESNTLKTFDVKKDSRRQAKRRKLEAFLDLVRKDELTPIPGKKKAGGTFQENYKALKDELRKYQKKQEKAPFLGLRDDGRCAIVNLSSSGEILNSTSPLFVEDMYHLLLTSVLGNLSPLPPRWVKLENAQNISKTVFIEIEGLSSQNLIEMHSKLNQDSCTFPFIVEIISSDISFAYDLSTSHINTGLHNQCKKGNFSMFPVDNTALRKTADVRSGYKFSKLHLLLSPIQLVMEHYPLPQSIFEQSKSEGYCFSKESYTAVNEKSPMFAIDCEMCRTETGRQEVTRIAMVDEDLKVVYHSLVKPKDEIIDYVTRFSGITKGMLADVTTTLDDVQRDIQQILPSAAILCGQSLNCDLHSLRMIHPYIIDTSIIFNNHGVRYKKTSLKRLAQIHLKEKIQDDKSGHNPIQDAIATMKLVQLKLKKNIKYGDAVLCSNESESNEAIGDITCERKENSTSEDKESNLANKASTIADYIKCYPDCKEKGLFARLSRFSKKVCIIGPEVSLNNYCAEMITDNVKKIIQLNMKKIIKTISDNIDNHDLFLSHLSTDVEDCLTINELSEELKKIYDTFPDKTLFVIFMSGINKHSDEKFKHSYCIVNLKK